MGAAPWHMLESLVTDSAFTRTDAMSAAPAVCQAAEGSGSYRAHDGKAAADWAC